MRRKAFLFTFLVLSLLLAACVRGGGTEGENSYTIYYPAAELRDVPGEDAIVARTVQLPDADTLTQEELAQRLLERLLADAPDAGVRAPMPGGTTLLSLSVLGNWARVDFSRQYARLAGIDLTLADYCVTLTLTQLDGVNAVSITSGGRELPYRETQTLTAADPLLSMREDALRPITVSLYFLDPTSGALRAEKRALALYEGQTRVNALLEALAQAPRAARSQPCCRRSSPCSPPAWRRGRATSICPPTPISASRRGRRWSRWCSRSARSTPSSACRSLWTARSRRS